MTNRERQIARFNEIMDELKALHERKGLDYGTDEDSHHNVRAGTAWGIPAWVSAMVRANDKVVRLQSLAKTGHLANEGAIDAFNDLACYAIISRMEWEEEQRDKGV